MGGLDQVGKRDNNLSISLFFYHYYYYYLRKEASCLAMKGLFFLFREPIHVGYVLVQYCMHVFCMSSFEYILYPICYCVEMEKITKRLGAEMKGRKGFSFPSKIQAFFVHFHRTAKKHIVCCSIKRRRKGDALL